MATSTPTPSIVRWGFLGCGRITHDFVTAMAPIAEKTAVLAACAARSLSSAEQFAATHNIAKAYGSYEELCADPEVDIIYVGTINTTHAEHAQLALRHGKHVLVEKPMTMNAREAGETIALAREKGLFFLEGVWTRFFPAVRHVRELLAQGTIGDVQYVQADMGIVVSPDSDFASKSSTGGGALLGIGIYPLSFVTMALGTEPTKVTAVGKLSENSEVDVFANVTLEFGGDKFATMQYSLRTEMCKTLMILGSKGRILINSLAHAPSRVTLVKYGENRELNETTSQFPIPEIAPDARYNFTGSEGLLYEAEAATNAIQSKLTEAIEYPADESLAIQKIMDEIRKQLGVVYDADKK